MTKRNGTKTRSFGVGVRENHDSRSYYARQLMPIDIDASVDLDPEPRPEKSLPKEALNHFFCKSSEKMHDLPERSVHLMVTSPPYNVGKEYDKDLSMAEYLELIEKVMSETHRVLVDGGRACVNVANIGRKPYIPLHAYIIQIAARVGFFMRGEIIWDKGMSGSSTAWGSWMSPSNPTLRDTHEYILVFQKPPFGRKRTDEREPTITREDFLEHTKSTWRFTPASAREAEHPAPFPTELPRRLIELYTYPGDVVLDPFMGTGATAIASWEYNRVFVGYDIEQKYVDIAKSRLKEAQMTAQYEHIAERNLAIVETDFADSSLRSYFDNCFSEVVAMLRLYPAYVCMNCPVDDRHLMMFGRNRKRCQQCNSTHVYQISNFQARSSATGAAFQAAVRVLFRRLFEIEICQTDSAIVTHNMGIADDIAVEAKGSPETITIDDGTRYRLPRAGMLRTDTQRKTHNNAQRFKSVHPNGSYFVLSNALPENLEQVKSSDVDGYCNVTNAESVREFFDAIEKLQNATAQNANV